MRDRRLCVSIVIAVVLVSVGALAQSPGQLPLEPIRDSGQSITGAFEGWYENADGSYSLLVGYFNRNNKQTLDIPVGPNNKIEPGDPDRGQPTHFLPRRQWGVFAIRVPKDFGTQKLTWTITANGQTTTIPLHLNPLWVVEPLKDAALGNTPPTIKFAADGKPFQGPPVGFATTYSATVSAPLALDAWVTDDGILPPERSANPGRGGARVLATISWSKYRGPGAVTFEDPRPTVEATDGKASTTAKFELPGEYILRLQANDSSGEGGGGFQCCWTNAHVKVTVTGTPTSK